MSKFLLPFTEIQKTSRLFSPPALLISAFALAIFVSIQNEPIIVFTILLLVLFGGTIAKTSWGRVISLAAKFEIVILFWVFFEPFVYGRSVMFFLQTPWGPAFAYWEGFWFGILLALRMFTIMLLFLGTFSHMTLSEFIGALKRIKVPSVILGSLMIMLRYIPLFIEERSRMQDAQALRGFDKGERMDKLRSLGYLVGSTIDRAFGRSVTVYESMALRGFGHGSFIGGSGFKRADIALPVIIVTIIVSLLFLSPLLLELIIL